LDEEIEDLKEELKDPQGEKDLLLREIEVFIKKMIK